MIEGLRVLAQAPLDERSVAQPDRDEDVEPRAALDEQSCHVRCIMDEVLRRRRLVIHIARVEVGATIDEVLRDLGRAGVVQRRLPIAAAGVDERRITVDEVAQAIEHAEVRRGEDVDDRASRDERRRFLGCAVVFQKAEAAGPPRALEVEIGAVRQQDVEQRQVLRRSCDRPAVEIADRLVDGCSHLGVAFEQLADALDVAGVQRADKLLHRRLGERIDLALHRRPALEAVAAGDDQLRIGQHEGIGRRRLRVQRADPDQRVRIAGPRGAQQFLRALLLHLQVRPGRKGFDENGSVWFGRHDDTSRKGLCPLSARTGWRFVRQRWTSEPTAGGSIPSRGRGASCTRVNRIAAPAA